MERPIAGSQAPPHPHPSAKPLSASVSQLIPRGLELFFLGKSFLVITIENFLYLKPGCWGSPTLRVGSGLRTDAARQAAAPALQPPAANPLSGQDACLPWRSLARSRTHRRGRLLRRCGWPRGRDKPVGQRSRPSPRREAQLVAPAAAAVARREPGNPHTDMRFIHFSLLLLFNSCS